MTGALAARWRRIGPPLLLCAVLLGLWEAYARASGISPFVLPAPSQVLGAVWAYRDQAIRHAIPTIVETALGFGLAILFATVVAVALDRVALARRAVEPLLVGSQTIPIIAVAPLLVVWFGFGLLPKVLIVVALLDGFAGTPAEATDLMRSFGSSDAQTFRKLRWPSGLPGLFTGLRIAATYAIVAAVIAEYVGATEGLGIWMQFNMRLFRTDLVFAAILLTAVLSIGLYLAVVAAERAVIPWYRASRDAARDPGPRTDDRARERFR